MNRLVSLSTPAVGEQSTPSPIVSSKVDLIVLAELSPKIFIVLPSLYLIFDLPLE